MSAYESLSLFFRFEFSVTLFLIPTLFFDATEQRDVSVFDVPGAYLQIEVTADKLILLRIRY